MLSLGYFSLSACARLRPVFLLATALGFALLAPSSSFALPPGPALQHPGDNAVEHVTLPYFHWSDVDWSSLGLDAYTGSYEIQIGKTEDLASVTAGGVIPAFLSFYSPSTELEYREYYWQVRHLDASGVPDTEWSSRERFTVAQADQFFNLGPDSTWESIKATLRAASLYTSENPGKFAEVRLSPAEVEIHVEQPACDPSPQPRSGCPEDDADDSPRCEQDEENDYLFNFVGSNHIIVNGRNGKIVIRAHPTRRTAGLYRAQRASHLQLKKLMVDYEPGSLTQFGGRVTQFDPEARSFTVEVDSDVYANPEELSAVDCGFFVDAAKQQRVGTKVSYRTTETWQEARQGTSNVYDFTSQQEETSRDFFKELEIGDYFLSSDRGGDIVLLDYDVHDFVANNLVVEGSRGRYFVVRHDKKNAPLTPSTFNRSINNQFLRKEGRILGSPSGGVNDKGIRSWHEGVTIEYTRDDAFHTGVPVGSENVLRRSMITGAFRNSAWIQSDRSWVEGNTISYGGTDGISIGGTGRNAQGTHATQLNHGLISDNQIIAPRTSGIISVPRSSALDPDPETGDYNQNIAIIGNTIRDHQSNEAMRLDYLKDSEVSNNAVESTGIFPWRIYSAETSRIGIHVLHSQDVVGAWNEVRDPRIACSKRREVDPGTTIDVDLGIFGGYESWRCTDVQAFTAPGEVTSDLPWTINAENFQVEVLDSAVLGSRAFGRVTSNVLLGGHLDALDKHTVTLSRLLVPGTEVIRLQARFAFNALTPQGRSEARLGVENTATGELYGVGLTAQTTTSPVQLFVGNANNAISLGEVNEQSTSGAWEVDATFRRVSSTKTKVDYVVTRPNGAPYSGTAVFLTAVDASASFDRLFLSFKQRAQVIFDWIQVSATE